MFRAFLPIFRSVGNIYAAYSVDIMQLFYVFVSMKLLEDMWVLVDILRLIVCVRYPHTKEANIHQQQ
jgi:hypothetical protein